MAYRCKLSSYFKINMTEHYVTLFDRLYLPQGLALHMSMERQFKSFKLWIVCMDKEVHDALSKIDLKNVELLKISDVETEDLKKVKSSRTKGEYCWTITPFTPKFIFDADQSISRVTYVDADLWFRNDPSAIFEEFENSGKSLFITDHAYAPEYDLSDTFGQFCVQFVIFVRDDSEIVRKWWADRCLEWCFNRLEGGKFGDQKYLDALSVLFKKKVHVLQNKELALAPWNASRFPFGNSVFFHFHGVRLLSRNKVHLGVYKIPKIVFEKIYAKYFMDLKDAINTLNKHGYGINRQMHLGDVLRTPVKKVLKFFDMLRFDNLFTIKNL